MKEQKNKRGSSDEGFVRCRASLRGAFGDKEITVQIRSNSHYRNSALLSSQVGMLIAPRRVNSSWAKEGTAGNCADED